MIKYLSLIHLAGPIHMQHLRDEANALKNLSHKRCPFVAHSVGSFQVCARPRGLLGERTQMGGGGGGRGVITDCGLRLPPRTITCGCFKRPGVSNHTRSLVCAIFSQGQP